MRNKGRRLALQQQTETRDAYGAAIITWSTTATTWARPKYIYGTEGFSGDQVNAQAQINWYIRNASEWSAIDNTWRAKDTRSSKVYEITAVKHVEHDAYRSDEIMLICMESERDDE